MPTDQDITIYAGADLSQDLDATTSGKTYAIRVMDRWYNQVSGTGFAVAIKDASNITVSISATNSDALITPPQIQHGKLSAVWGNYQITETSSGGAITRIYQGKLHLSRNKA